MTQPQAQVYIVKGQVQFVNGKPVVGVLVNNAVESHHCYMARSREPHGIAPLSF